MVRSSLSRNCASFAGVQRALGAAEIAGLRRAAGGHRGRVEVDDHRLAGEVGERDEVAVGIGQGEGRGNVAHVKSWSLHAARVNSRGPRPVRPCTRARGGAVARDAETIQAEIERARDSLATAVDELTTRANPKRVIEEGRKTVLATLQDPKVKYSLIAVGALLAVVVIRRLFR